MNAPQSFVGGDTVEWLDDLADYPSSDWDLTYTFLDAASKHVVAAVGQADGTYKVTLTPTVTKEWPPSDYDWTARVVHKVDGRTFSVDHGKTRVYPDPDQLVTFDGRSWAQQGLAAVEAVLAGRATKDQEAYSVAGRSLSRTPIADLLNLRTFFLAEVNAEYDAANPDKPSRKKAVVRF